MSKFESLLFKIHQAIVWFTAYWALMDQECGFKTNFLTQISFWGRYILSAYTGLTNSVKLLSMTKKISFESPILRLVASDVFPNIDPITGRLLYSIIIVISGVSFVYMTYIKFILIPQNDEQISRDLVRFFYKGPVENDDHEETRLQQEEDDDGPGDPKLKDQISQEEKVKELESMSPKRNKHKLYPAKIGPLKIRDDQVFDDRLINNIETAFKVDNSRRKWLFLCKYFYFNFILNSILLTFICIYIVNGLIVVHSNYFEGFGIYCWILIFLEQLNCSFNGGVYVFSTNMFIVLYRADLTYKAQRIGKHIKNITELYIFNDGWVQGPEARSLVEKTQNKIVSFFHSIDEFNSIIKYYSIASMIILLYSIFTTRGFLFARLSPESLGGLWILFGYYWSFGFLLYNSSKIQKLSDPWANGIHSILSRYKIDLETRAWTKILLICYDDHFIRCFWIGRIRPLNMRLYSTGFIFLTTLLYFLASNQND